MSFCFEGQPGWFWSVFLQNMLPVSDDLLLLGDTFDKPEFGRMLGHHLCFEWSHGIQCSLQIVREFGHQFFKVINVKKTASVNGLSKQVGVYGSNFTILQFLMCEWGFWYVEQHFHCKVTWPSGPWVKLVMVMLLLHLVKTRSRMLPNLWVEIPPTDMSQLQP